MNFIVTLFIVLLEVLIVLIFLRAVLSWFTVNPDNALVNLVTRITEPVLSPLRRLTPRGNVVDFTPFFAIVLLQIISYFLFLLF